MSTKNLNDPIQARIHENSITIKKSKMRIFRKKLNAVHPIIIPARDVMVVKSGISRVPPKR